MYSKDVYKTWALILQLGISVLVPLFMLIAVGFFLKAKFSIDLMLIFVILGVLVGIRNAYTIINSYLKNMNKKSGSDLMEKHMKQFK